MRTPPVVVSRVCSCALAALLVLAPVAAEALSTINVTTTTMTKAPDGNCSLVEAFEAASLGSTVNECIVAGGQPIVINLTAATYTFLMPFQFTDGTLGPAAGYFPSGIVEINGNGATLANGGAGFRMFAVNTATLTLRNVRVSGFSAPGGAQMLSQFGGAIAVYQGALNIEDSTFTANTLQATGGDGTAIFGHASTINIHRSAVIDNVHANNTRAQIWIYQGSILNLANSTVSGPLTAVTTNTSSVGNVSSSTILGSPSSVSMDGPGTITARNSIVDGACFPLNGGTLTLANTGATPGCVGALALPVTLAPAANGGLTPTRALQLPSTATDQATGCTYLSSGTNPLFTNAAAITTDQRGAARGAVCDLGAYEALPIAPLTLPGGTFGSPYSQTITLSGGTSPYAFAVASGSLPGGITLSTTLGTLTGSPTAAGNFAFEIAVTDAGGLRTVASYAVNIAKASQSITFGALGAKVFGAAPFGVSGTATSTLPVAFSSLTTGVCTVAAGTVTIIAGGTCTIQASQPGNANYNAAPPVPQSFTVTPAAQSITFGALAGKAFGDVPFAVSATASSTLPVAFSSLTTGVCTLAGNTVTIVAPGTCTVAADQAGNASYNPAAQVPQSFAVVKGAQTIAFASLAGKVFGDPPFAVGATATSTLPVTFSSLTTGVCTVAGSSVTILVPGTCTIAADQSGNTNYNAAPQVPQGFAVGKASQTIAFAAIPAHTFGDAPFGVGATSTSTLPVTFTSSTPLVCTLAGTTVTLVASGTCTIAADQVGNTNYNAAPQVPQGFAVAKAAQTITFPAIPAHTFGDAPFAIGATATSTLPVTFSSLTPLVCTVAGATVTLVAGGTCTIAADQAGNGNFNAAAQVQNTVGVSKGSQSITFPAIPAHAFGDPPFAISATSSASLPVTFSSLTPLVCTVAGTTVTIVATGTCTIAADAAGNASFNAAPQVQQGVGVAKSNQAITFGALASRNFGAAAFTVSATASSTLAVTYTSLTASACTVSGATVTLAAPGTCTIAANQPGDTSFNAAPQVTQSFSIVAVVPAAPTIGTATPGNGTIAVTFTAPVFTGGVPIVSYTATCGSASLTGTSSPITLSGLANGTAYTCTVTATNSVGAGPASAPASTTPSLNTFSGATSTGSGIATVTFTGGGPGCTFAPAGTGPLQSSFFIPLTGHPKSPPASPVVASFEHGLLDFVLIGCTPGSTMTFTVTYPTPLAAGSHYWKYGPTASQAAAHWYILPAALAGNTAVFSITDGGLGDDDLAANGTVVDQGGPGVPVASDPVQIPTLSEWAMLLLASLMLVTGLRPGARKRIANR